MEIKEAIDRFEEIREALKDGIDFIPIFYEEDIKALSIILKSAKLMHSNLFVDEERRLASFYDIDVSPLRLTMEEFASIGVLFEEGESL